MAIIGLILTVVGGLLDWSGWWAIPIGLMSFMGARRTLPEDKARINAVGVPIYIIMTFILMKASGWVGSFF